MDLGLVTTEGGVGVGGAEDTATTTTTTTTSVNAASSAANSSSDPFGINISKTLGSSGLLKQQRSGVSSSSLHDTWRAGKVPRPNEFGGGGGSSIGVYNQTQAPTFLRSGSMIPSSNGQTMISFSSQSQTPVYPDEDVGAKTSAFPFFLSSSSQDQLTSKTSGDATEKATEAIRGPFARFRGPFTPSQWMELEHQALIFKHILANVPVPSQLLIPLKKSFNPYAFTGFSSGSYGSSSLGWGSFHLGFAGSTDPEPGRCRRTDGKKWRCSRDAVPDQKYCERHINRGRHRSRKPVEGQTGHAVSGSNAPKGLPNASSSSASVISSSSVSNCLGGVQQHQFKNLQPGAANTANEHLVSRMQDLQSLSMLGDTINLKSKDTSFSSQKPQAQIGGSTQPEFGIVSPHSLLNPSQKSSTMNSPRETASFTSFNEQDVHGHHHPLRHFIDNWPKDHSDRGSVTWPEELKSDWTQLSMSIPMSSSDFSSSSNSPPQEKITTLSPLRLAREIDHIQMGLSVNNEQKHSNWLLPVSWGTSNGSNSSLGGPLGEVLNSTTSYCMGGSRNSSAALNLMTQQQQQQQMWGGDGSSPPPQMGCSPTGVLQKSTFVSLSNSSSGSSPRNDHNNKVKAASSSLCDDILASSASIPSI